MLTRSEILALFNELNDELAQSNTRGDVFVVGGAAMTRLPRTLVRRRAM